MDDTVTFALPWRVAIADDEPLARQRIRALLAPHARFEVVVECCDGREALEALDTHHPDVLFLDIRMPGLDGVAVAASIATNAQSTSAAPAIVFVTAWDTHAVAAFDLDAIDYLVKPVDIDRFDRMISRLAQRLDRAVSGKANEPEHQADAIRAALETLARLGAGPLHPTRFAVRDAKGVYFVATEDVERVEADGNYVALCVQGRRHLVRESMRTMEARLDPARFVRIHRSAIVSVERVMRLQPWGHGEYLVTMSDGTKLTSSRTYNTRLQKLIRPRGRDAGAGES